MKKYWNKFKRFMIETGIAHNPVHEDYLTMLFYGPRSAGKSLHQAKFSLGILKWLDDLYKLYPELPQAIVVSNQLFNKQITEQYANAPRPGGQRLFYWENIRQLRYCPRKSCWKSNDIEDATSEKDEPGLPNHHRMHDAYIIFDDIATIIPADGWATLPKWFRKIFAQAGHNGIHCIANIQDPVSADINFRRYVDICVKFRKVFGSRRPEEGKPPVRWIYGIYTTRSVSAEELYKKGDLTETEIIRLKEEHPELTEGNWEGSWFWIFRKDTEIYDTTQNVPEWQPDSMEHIEYKCLDPTCDYVHVKHQVV